MPKIFNRAKMSTATTGTGTITLGSASTGYQTFAAAGVTDADVIRYVIEDGNNWEIGEGTYTASGTTLSRTVLESTNSDAAITLSGSAEVFIDAVAEDIIAEVVEDTTPTLGGDLDGGGNEVAHYTNSVVGTVSGTLTTTAHSGNVIVTSGNITVPTTAGFTCVIIAGGAHTVTFNSTTSAAMATGDIMTVMVEDGTTIHAVLTESADKVSFT